MRGVARLAARHAGALWSALRAASGDDAYERYRAHQAARHALEPPLSRRAFYEDAQRRKWSGVSRCC
ncbi:MAG: YbdD/YjiX family protein [Gammaproteobacteria bacterium]|nr:MAG: YbdD/YjiX family protein [Gammaproteobacteria bacterium]TLZ41429.1 MAG: YbdD/YjiX family protein [Gammaproteobacteria bacterium]